MLDFRRSTRSWLRRKFTFRKKSSATKFLKFFLLPLEIREQIYFYTMLTDGGVRWCEKHFTSVPVYVPGKSLYENRGYSILKVSRQVHDEATEVLYRRFSFYLSQVCLFKDLYSGLDHLSELHLAQIQSFDVKVRLYVRTLPEDNFVWMMKHIRQRLPSLRSIMLTTYLNREATAFGKEWLKDMSQTLLEGLDLLRDLKDVNVTLSVVNHLRKTGNIETIICERLQPHLSGNFNVRRSSSLNN